MFAAAQNHQMLHGSGLLFAGSPFMPYGPIPPHLGGINFPGKF